jgi:hypothetical protein
MKKPHHMLNNETGSLMVITVVLLMLLTIMGLAITTTTSIELQIAANDRIHKTTFYAADGATDVASELLEQNLGCMTGGGFSSADINTIRVLNLDFWRNRSNDPDFVSIPSDAVGDRDFVFPATAVNDPSIPHTNVTAGYNPGFSTGSAMQMVSGYEGKGKAIAAGGAFLQYEINSQHLGVANSESIIQIQWRHMIGSEGACNH